MLEKKPLDVEYLPLDLDQTFVSSVINAITYQLVLIGGDGKILAANAAWRSFRCHHQFLDDCVGQHYYEVFGENHGVPADTLERLEAGVTAVMTGSLACFQFVYPYELYKDQAASQTYWLELTISPLTDVTDKGQGVLITQRDISKQKQYESDLLARANSDELTGLMNRSAFLLEGTHMLALAKRQGWNTALVYLDLDNFKSINDRYGHQVGNDVLVEVARALKQQTRESDLLARIGGDEFVILLGNVSIMDCAYMVQSYQRRMPESPVAVQGSFGVSYYPEGGSTITDLLAQADKAMYQAKATGVRHRRTTRNKLRS